MTKSVIKDRMDQLDFYDEVLQFDNLGDRLKYLRKNYKSISMQEFCTCMNIPRSYEYLYENNEAVPKEERLIKFANFYNVDINILDPKKSFTLSTNEYNIIFEIYTTLCNKKDNLNKLEYSNITIAICNSILFINQILKEENRKEFYEYFVNSSLVDIKTLEADEKSIIHYLEDIKKKASNVENISVSLDYLFRVIINSIHFKSFDQKTFNILLKHLSNVVEVLFS